MNEKKSMNFNDLEQWLNEQQQEAIAAGEFFEVISSSEDENGYTVIARQCGDTFKDDAAKPEPET